MEMAFPPHCREAMLHHHWVSVMQLSVLFLWVSLTVYYCNEEYGICCWPLHLFCEGSKGLLEVRPDFHFPTVPRHVGTLLFSEVQNQLLLEHKLVLIILVIYVYVKLIDDAQQNQLDQQDGYFILHILRVC
jgi:hypothetical protein